MTVEREQYEDDVTDIENHRPTTSQVVQDAYNHPAVPVRVTDPVQVQQVPRVTGVSRKLVLADTATVKILNQDSRRTKATVWCSQIMSISPDQAAVEQSAAAEIPANTMYEIGTDELWYAKPAAAATIHVITEQWVE